MMQLIKINFIMNYFSTDGSREEANPSNMQGFFTALNCRTVRIGSYRYTPKEKVSILLGIMNSLYNHNYSNAI